MELLDDISMSYTRAKQFELLYIYRYIYLRLHENTEAYENLIKDNQPEAQMVSSILHMIRIHYNCSRASVLMIDTMKLRKAL